MAFAILSITEAQYQALRDAQESHFFELKSADNFEPISKSLSAFGNAEGGRLIVGAADKNSVRGDFAAYPTQEDANGHVSEISKMFHNAPEALDINFLRVENRDGFLVDINVGKSASIIETPARKVFMRLNAQNIELKGTQIQELSWRKGQASYEDVITEEKKNFIDKSKEFARFRDHMIPATTGIEFLDREKLSRDEYATVAGVLLFDDLPQSTVTQSAIKVYRYKTVEAVGERAELAEDPMTIEGPAHHLVYESVRQTKRIIDSITILGLDGLESIKYPPEAIHEIICNAVVHRDYSIHDYVHIRIFDNRVEVQSPGRLAAHITPDNIRRHRFARNKRLVRILNKFPNPPNKDVGEGLRTAFSSMRSLNLQEPIIQERDQSVQVTLRHEPLASKEERIRDYLKEQGTINNSKAREICFERSDSIMRKTFQGMMLANIIERVPGSMGKGAKYRLVDFKV